MEQKISVSLSLSPSSPSQNQSINFLKRIPLVFCSLKTYSLNLSCSQMTVRLALLILWHLNLGIRKLHVHPDKAWGAEEVGVCPPQEAQSTLTHCCAEKGPLASRGSHQALSSPFSIRSSSRETTLPVSSLSQHKNMESSPCPALPCPAQNRATEPLCASVSPRVHKDGKNTTLLFSHSYYQDGPR